MGTRYKTAVRDELTYIGEAMDVINLVENRKWEYKAESRNESIDWDTLDRPAEDSPDFKKFISDLTEDIALGKVISKYDEVISDENLEHI